MLLSQTHHHTSFLEMSKYQFPTFTQSIQSFTFPKPDYEQPGLIFFYYECFAVVGFHVANSYSNLLSMNHFDPELFLSLLSFGCSQRRQLVLTLGKLIKCVKTLLHRKVCNLQEQGLRASYLEGLGQEPVRFQTNALFHDRCIVL